jgi:hypothetical protein
LVVLKILEDDFIHGFIIKGAEYFEDDLLREIRRFHVGIIEITEESSLPSQFKSREVHAFILQK